MLVRVVCGIVHMSNVNCDTSLDVRIPSRALTAKNDPPASFYAKVSSSEVFSMGLDALSAVVSWARSFPPDSRLPRRRLGGYSAVAAAPDRAGRGALR